MGLILIDISFIVCHTILEIYEGDKLLRWQKILNNSINLVIQVPVNCFYIFLTVHFYGMGLRYVKMFILNDIQKIERIKFAFSLTALILIVYFVLQINMFVTPYLFQVTNTPCWNSYLVFEQFTIGYYVIAQFSKAMILACVVNKIFSRLDL